MMSSILSDGPEHEDRDDVAEGGGVESTTRGRRWVLVLIAVALMLVVAGAVYMLGRTTIRYQVGWTGEHEVPVTVRYTLPSGNVRMTKTETPWESDPFVFRRGDTLQVEASLGQDVDEEEWLTCRLASVEEQHGIWTSGVPINPPGAPCRTEYRLGQWPPNDLTTSLIRVG